MKGTMQIRSSFLLLFALSAGTTFAQAPQDLATQAKTAYDQKHYAASAALYEESILEAEPEDLASTQYNG